MRSLLNDDYIRPRRRSCKHGWTDTEEGCPQCYADRQQAAQQAAHEASIKRQRSKLKVAPWRSDPNRGDFVPA